jgi:23S rRNA (cytidine1920-2'-O)/16S rRNA (cytidine1409-2'-O)-methyltransferase
LRNDPRIELHERTDIRDVKDLSAPIDVVVADVSFISLREILPYIAKLVDKNTQIVAMCKPQFEAGLTDVHKGVIKNDAMRRRILKDFEDWTKKSFKIADKADSAVAGSKGNLERFYLLKKTL